MMPMSTMMISRREAALRFSLAGVQLKFSAVMEASGGLTIPADGMGGSWIVKLPSARFPAVPENEFAMLELARRVGIAVPDNRLVEIAKIKGTARRGAHTAEGKALAVQRFDRVPGGEPVHMEDFAQVFGLFPDDKYDRRSYANIASVLWAETGEEATCGVCPPPRIFRADRQRRHASQELVAALSRPAHARPVAGL